MQLIDFARNRGECIEFLGFFNTYYSELKNAVFEAHNAIGRATVGDIVNQMLKSENKYVKFKAAMTFPELPSRMDVLVVGVLKEAGAVPVKVGRKIYIDPVQP
ncbi:MAG: hypothetical protein GX800_04710 [Clostridiaceae bacterium]|nr:hypothetical protein [Clostridiaceae bacterium]